MLAFSDPIIEDALSFNFDSDSIRGWFFVLEVISIRHDWLLMFIGVCVQLVYLFGKGANVYAWTNIKEESTGW